MIKKSVKNTSKIRLFISDYQSCRHKRPGFIKLRMHNAKLNAEAVKDRKILDKKPQVIENSGDICPAHEKFLSL